MSAKLKRTVFRLVKFALPVAVIWYLLSQIQPEEWADLKNSQRNYGFLISALLVTLVSTTISYVRWCFLVRSHGIPLTILEGIRLGTVGFMLNFVSPGSVGGDLFKAIFLAQRSPGQRIECFATVLVDRIVGLYGLLVVASAALLIIGDRLPGENAFLIRAFVFGSTLGGAAGMFGMVLGGKWIDRLLELIKPVKHVGPFIHRIADPLRAFRSHTGVFMLTILMSVAVHILLSLSVFFIAAGLFDSYPNFTEHLVIVPLANAFAGIPLFPGGVGMLEAALEQLYETIPATPTLVSGTLIGLAFEITKIIIAAIGIIFYWTGGREVQETMQAAQNENSSDADVGNDQDSETA